MINSISRVKYFFSCLNSYYLIVRKNSNRKRTLTWRLNHPLSTPLRNNVLQLWSIAIPNIIPIWLDLIDHSDNWGIKCRDGINYSYAYIFCKRTQSYLNETLSRWGKSNFARRFGYRNVLGTRSNRKRYGLCRGERVHSEELLFRRRPVPSHHAPRLRVSCAPGRYVYLFTRAICFIVSARWRRRRRCSVMKF